jgi:hypothetical protein
MMKAEKSAMIEAAANKRRRIEEFEQNVMIAAPEVNFRQMNL